MENDNICAQGKVSLPNKRFLLLQPMIHEKELSVLENEFSLNSDDIYKDLRVMCYDYSGEFQRLKNIRTNDFQEIQGICEWNGNVITFLDSLLQSMILATPFRKLMVPVMIESLRINPKILFENITVKRIKEEFHLNAQNTEKVGKELFNDTNAVSEEDRMSPLNCFFKAAMPFFHNSKLLVTHGIEVENITMIPIPRKVDTTNLVVDSYEFVANEDNNAIESCDRKHIIEYLEVFLNNILISVNNTYSLKGMQINGSETETNGSQRLEM